MIGGGPGRARGGRAGGARRRSHRAVRRESRRRRPDLSRHHLTRPSADRSVLGADYWAGEALAAEARAQRGAVIVNGATVWSLDPRARRRRLDRRQGAHDPGTAGDRRHRLASNGRFPIPGWTLPGVMTAGAAQTVLKAQGLLAQGPHGAGRHRSAALAAGRADLRAGGKHRGHPRHHAARQLAARAGRTLPDFLLSPYFAKGLKLLREVRAKVPVLRVDALEAVGSGKLERGALSARGGTSALPADLAAAAPGRRAQRQPRPRGRRRRTNGTTRQLCFQPVLDADFGSSVPGIAVAGDGAGIAGGTAAAERGRLAAIAAVRALKPEASVPDPQIVRQRLQREEMGRAFLDWLNRPAESLPPARGRHLVCRCEEVTARQVARHGRHGLRGPQPDEGLPALRHGPVPGPRCAASPSPS